jgi:hypothetical protein
MSDARCRPCLNSHHDRCTGSAGNVGCYCIHALDVAAPVLHPVEPLPVVPLDPDKVRERLAELDREVAVQQGVVDAVDGLLDLVRSELASLERQRDGLLAHPAIRAALERARS